MKKITAALVALFCLAFAAPSFATVTQAMTNQCKLDSLTTIAGHTLKIALYTQAAATLSASTTAYTATGEVTGTGYTAGGSTLTGCAASLSGSKAQITCTGGNAWSSSTITADAAMIYDSTNSNHALGVYTFTSASSSSGTFTVTIPADVLNVQ